MAFKSIGTLAGDVLKSVEVARAAKSAHEYGPDHYRAERKAGPGATNSSEVQLPSHLPHRRDTGGMGNEVACSDGDQSKPGSHVTGVKRRANASGKKLASTRLPTIGKDTITAIPHELPRSAVVVSLAMERARRHYAASGSRIVSSLRN